MQKLHDSVDNLEELDKILKLFTRSFLKKSIMTEQYSVKYLSFFKYFETQILQSEYAEFFNKNKENINIVMQLFYNFNNFLTNSEEFASNLTFELFYENISSKGFRLTMFDGFKVDLGFFEKTQSDSRITLNFKNTEDKTVRNTIVRNVYSDSISIRNTLSALRPHFIHAVESASLRVVNITKFGDDSYFTIHDCYLIPFQEHFIFIDQINEVMKFGFLKELDEKDLNNINIINNFVRNKEILNFYNYFIIL